MEQETVLRKKKHNKLISQKRNKTCATFNYTEHKLILFSTFLGCAFISAFASLIVIPLVIASCVVGLKMCIKIAGIKVFKSIIKKKEKSWQNSTVSKN